MQSDDCISRSGTCGTVKRTLCCKAACCILSYRKKGSPPRRVGFVFCSAESGQNLLLPPVKKKQEPKGGFLPSNTQLRYGERLINKENRCYFIKGYPPTRLVATVTVLYNATIKVGTSMKRIAILILIVSGLLRELIGSMFSADILRTQAVFCWYL